MFNMLYCVQYTHSVVVYLFSSMSKQCLSHPLIHYRITSYYYLGNKYTDWTDFPHNESMYYVEKARGMMLINNKFSNGSTEV